jgi:hypothetical protein
MTKHRQRLFYQSFSQGLFLFVPVIPMKMGMAVAVIPMKMGIHV